MSQESDDRRRRLIGMGFVLAFLLSTATIIYTGLNVRAPGSHRTENAQPQQENSSPAIDAQEPAETSEPAQTPHQ